MYSYYANTNTNTNSICHYFSTTTNTTTTTCVVTMYSIAFYYFATPTHYLTAFLHTLFITRGAVRRRQFACSSELYVRVACSLRAICDNFSYCCIFESFYLIFF